MVCCQAAVKRGGLVLFAGSPLLVVPGCVHGRVSEAGTGASGAGDGRLDHPLFFAVLPSLVAGFVGVRTGWDCSRWLVRSGAAGAPFVPWDVVVPRVGVVLAP